MLDKFGSFRKSLAVYLWDKVDFAIVLNKKIKKRKAVVISRCKLIEHVTEG